MAPVSGVPNFEAVQTLTDPLGLLSTFAYDAKGNKITVVSDAGTGHFNATSQFTYDAQGRVLTGIDPVGAVTVNAYDSFGDLTSVTADWGMLNGAIAPACLGLCQLTKFGYDTIGNLTSVTNPNGQTTTATFDANRRPLTTTLPAAPNVLTSTLTYDPDGRVLQTQQSSNVTVLSITSATYTPSGKIATATDATGAVTLYTYDADDRLSQVTDAAGRAIVTTYDALSRPYQQFNLATQATPLSQRGYTPNSKLASLTDANNNTTTFT